MVANLVSLTELLIDGIARGLVFALLGVGITLVFGLGGILNLAIGVFSVVAVIVAVKALGLVSNLAVAVLVAVVFVGALGLAVDRTILTFVYRADGEERTLLGIFVTLGLAIFLDGLLFIYYPSGYSLPLGVESVVVGGVHVRGSVLAVIATAVVLFAGLFAFFDRTYLGSATRTVMQDETGAILCGIPPRRIYTLVFVLSAMIVGFAGVLFSFTSEVQAAHSFAFTIDAIIVSIVGGVSSLTGTVAAGLLLGTIITFANAFIGAYVAQIVLLGIAVVALLLEPEQIT